MGKEIERKYLVKDKSWQGTYAKKIAIRQGYIAQSVDCIVRVRIANDTALVTLKGKQNSLTRSEFEYKIPLTDAEQMLKEFSQAQLIVKTRYCINYDGKEWVVDEFGGNNIGLVLAEIELADEQEQFAKPDWLGEEVSTEHKYSNAALAQTPYNTWHK